MRELEHVITSDTLGPMMKMKPVLVRRTMAGLREAGIVRSEKGHGGGWVLARPLDRVTLADVYRALGINALFNIGNREEKPRCLLEQAVNRKLASALEDAETRLMEELRCTSVEDIAAAVRKKQSTHSKKGQTRHV
jgi:DNA-binding IscR family transcriptional regulator